MRRAVPTSQARRIGLRDYAPAEDGRQPDVHIRTYDPVGDRFSYTSAGKAWLREGHKVDYVALIPVEIQTLRRSGAFASYMGFFSCR